jgi:hypothetical protein
MFRSNESSQDRTRALLRSMETAINDARARRTGQVARPLPRPEPTEPHATRPAPAIAPRTGPAPAAPMTPSAPAPLSGDGPPRLKAKPKRPSGHDHGLGGFGQRQAI